MVSRSAVMMAAIAIICSVQVLSASGWSAAPFQYPISAVGQQCVYSSGYVYCINGYSSDQFINNTYSAQVTSQGISQWANQTPYPLSEYGQSCVTSSGILYCLGGYNYSSYVNMTYAATLSDGMIVDWHALLPYPIGAGGTECASTVSDIICMGGNRSYVGETNLTYYTAIYGNVIRNPDGSGFSAWAAARPYPLNVSSASCVGSGNYVYCVGGQTDSGFTNSAYFAALNATGMSKWFATTLYPMNDSGIGCTLAQGYMVCVGGYNGITYSDKAYAAPVTNEGIGGWAYLANYPEPVSSASCVASGTTVYCIGGYNSTSIYSDAVYSIGITQVSQQATTVGIVSPNAVTITATSTSTTTTTTIPAGAGNKTALQRIESIATPTAYAVIAAVIVILALLAYLRVVRKHQSEKARKP